MTGKILERFVLNGNKQLERTDTKDGGGRTRSGACGTCTGGRRAA